MNRREVLRAGAAVVLGSTAGRSSTAADADPLAKAKAIPDGPFEPTWESVLAHYRVPDWFARAKFGIFIHWGLYAVPAHGNEWYAKHMYTSDVKWHTEHYGPPDKFGYKDFIPLFKAEKYDPAEWAALFKAAGARYVMPVAEHHDGFAMWDSNLTNWCAGKMGPKRDLIGDLAKAVKAAGMVFGVSDHRMEHHTFMYPAPGVKTDLFDPKYAAFYGQPVAGNMNDGNASPEFQEDWLARCQELIDKYEPEIIYFDNGVNDRNYDPIKLRLAAYYYNRAAEWRKQVTITTKDQAYLAGSVLDFEKSLRGPKWILPGAWEVDEPGGANSWGYVNGMHYRSPEVLLSELVDVVSKGGNLLLNVSPRADGTIPQEQQEILHAIGQWLAANGEGIYDSKPWHVYGEGPSVPPVLPVDWAGGSSARPQPAALPKPPRPPLTAQDFRFTTQGDCLYAFGMLWSGNEAVVRSLSRSAGQVRSVVLLGNKTRLQFDQREDALRVQLPAMPAVAGPYALKMEGVRGLGQV